MLAQRLHAFGDVSNFKLEDIPRPHAGPGQVLLRVAAASLNPVDYKIRANGPGFAPELPAVLGSDVAGTIEEIGSGVEGFAPGDEVYGSAGGMRGLDGTNAEYMPADARLLAPKPKNLSLEEAAALPLVAITAWEALYDRANIQAGQTVLVHGGAGGVGHMAIQLAKARGAKVFTTVSSPEKAEIARRLGADVTVNYRERTTADYVAELTDGQGFDVVFDTTGGSDLVNSLDAAKVNGTVLTIVSQYSCDLSLMHVKNLTLHVVFMLIPMIHDIGRAHHGDILRQVARMVEQGELTPLIDQRRFSLEELPAAHSYLETGQAVGKVLVRIG